VDDVILRRILEYPPEHFLFWLYYMDEQDDGMSHWSFQE
jgi:hypothetical protein